MLSRVPEKFFSSKDLCEFNWARPLNNIFAHCKFVVILIHKNAKRLHKVKRNIFF